MNCNKVSSQIEKDIQNIMNLVDVTNKSVLELGCGKGRITFAIAERVREIVGIDIDTEAIEEAQKKNKFGNVTFLTEDIESFDLASNFEIILSIGVGYMYLKDIQGAIRSISKHLEEEGVFLLICSSPEDEYQRIVDLIVEKNVRTVSFYVEFEKLLMSYFTFEKTTIKKQLTFSNFEEIISCFERELKEEYRSEMNKNHEQELIEYFRQKESLSIGNDSLVYLCRKK